MSNCSFFILSVQEWNNVSLGRSWKWSVSVASMAWTVKEWTHRLVPLFFFHITQTLAARMIAASVCLTFCSITDTRRTWLPETEADYSANHLVSCWISSVLFPTCFYSHPWTRLSGFIHQNASYFGIWSSGKGIKFILKLSNANQTGTKGKI